MLLFPGVGDRGVGDRGVVPGAWQRMVLITREKGGELNVSLGDASSARGVRTRMEQCRMDGIRCTVLDTRYLLYDTFYSGFDERCLILGTRYSVFDTQ